MLRVFIGKDWRENDAWDVCAHSLRRHASIPVEIEPIGADHPWYTRTFHFKGNQRYDDIDERPFSTDFSFARFLVPLVAQGSGWVLFCDCDFLWRADIAELVALADDSKAVMCVHHNYAPVREVKMDGVIQSRYSHKNWSSLVLWNTNHRGLYLPDTQWNGLTFEKVNTYPGSFLHSFSWIKGRDIGELPEEWNHLVGHSQCPDPKAVHFTEGGPWFEKYRDVEYADEWLQEQRMMRESPRLKVVNG